MYTILQYLLFVQGFVYPPWWAVSVLCISVVWRLLIPGSDWSPIWPKCCGHLGCFQFWPIMRKATINILAQASLWTYVFIFLSKLGVEFLGYRLWDVFNLLKNSQTFSQGGWTILCSHQWWRRAPLASHITDIYCLYLPPTPFVSGSEYLPGISPSWPLCGQLWPKLWLCMWHMRLQDQPQQQSCQGAHDIQRRDLAFRRQFRLKRKFRNNWHHFMSTCDNLFTLSVLISMQILQERHSHLKNKVTEAKRGCRGRLWPLSGGVGILA